MSRPAIRGTIAMKVKNSISVRRQVRSETFLEKESTISFSSAERTDLRVDWRQAPSMAMPETTESWSKSVDIVLPRGKMSSVHSPVRQHDGAQCTLVRLCAAAGNTAKVADPSR